MIFAKITPALSIATQNNFFSQEAQFITGSYLVVQAKKYKLGQESVRFNATFGNVIFQNEDITGFQEIHSTEVLLDGDTIANWGTDDSVILTAVAEQQGTTISQILSGSLEQFVN